MYLRAWGAPCRAPCNISSDNGDGGGDAINPADAIEIHKPQIPLAIIGSGGAQNACLFQINHKGVDGALVTARVQTHRAHKVAAGLGSVVDQAGADRGADDRSEHDRFGIVRGTLPPLECILRGQGVRGAGLSQSEIMKTCAIKSAHSASVITTQFFSFSSRCARSESFRRRDFIVR